MFHQTTTKYRWVHVDTALGFAYVRADLVESIIWNEAAKLAHIQLTTGRSIWAKDEASLFSFIEHLNDDKEEI